MLKLVRTLAFVIGIGSLIVSSIIFGIVVVPGMLLHLNIDEGVTYLLGSSVWLGFSMYIGLWSINRQSPINYLRLLGLPVAVALIFFIDGGPGHGLFYFMLAFIGVQILWNALLSFLQKMFLQRAEGVDGKKSEAPSH